MILSNFHKFFAMYMTGADVPITTYRGTAITAKRNLSYMSPPTMITHSGNYSAKLDTVITNTSKIADSDGAGGVIFGTGTTTPSVTDTALAGTILTNFTYACGVSAGVDDDGVYYTAVYTITNTGNSDFTIGEIGWVGIANDTATNNSYSNRKSVLFDRTVLDYPVTIPAGGVGKVTYTIRLNYPTA